MSFVLTEEIRTLVHDLEVKRGIRRGNVTKLQNRIVKSVADGPDRIQASPLQELFQQLSAAVDAHAAVQSQLEEYYDNYPELRSAARAEEDTELLDTHVQWKSPVSNVLAALPLRHQALALLNDTILHWLHLCRTLPSLGTLWTVCRHAESHCLTPPQGTTGTCPNSNRSAIPLQNT